MCGILGWYSKTSLNEKHKLFKKMLNEMNFRGKDNTGFTFKDNILLGHKRLSIVDIENGNQPMIYKNLIIVYNGEIYNTKDLKNDLVKKGYYFNTNCDTEVILKGFHMYKEKILDKLEGIFAFAVYDTITGNIFLARDRFGIKPLYYFKNRNNFIFSSMIKPILESKIIKAVLTKKELGELLALGPSKRVGSGIFKSIYELNPAHYMWCKKNKIKIKRYWNVVSKKCEDSFDVSCKKIKELVTNSIVSQMVSDVDIATLLSGGLDSSIITAVISDKLKEQNRRLTTYSIDYESNDKFFKSNEFQVSMDNYYIDLMSKTFDTNHQYKIISQEDVAFYLRESLYARDYPGMADIDSSLLWFSREISKEYKVILSGECADEIFGGYPWFYKEKLNNKNNFPWINNLDYRQSILNKNLSKKLNLTKICKKEYKRTINQLPRADKKNKYKKLFYINMTHFMTTLLDRKDRMTMKSTLEARVPFANTELVEYLWNIPFSYKYSNNTEKYILREAFKNLLPDEIINRKKNPYPKTHNPIYFELVSNLLSERLKNNNSSLGKVFDVNKIYELLNNRDDDLLPWFGQLMTKPQLVAYLYQFDLWIDEYNIELRI